MSGFLSFVSVVCATTVAGSSRTFYRPSYWALPLRDQVPGRRIELVLRAFSEVVRDLRLNDEPLLAEVFGFVEERYSERVSLKEVARAVRLSPGRLTTVVKRKTGRTVVEWIAECRLAQARRLLVETDLAVEEVGHRVGYNDPTYFVRSFRRVHGTTLLGWRRVSGGNEMPVDLSDG